MNSLLYVSKRRIPFAAGRDDVADIVSVARVRNAALGVTGALVVTPTHFAQMLEGSTAALDELLVSIDRDTRHSDMRLTRLPTNERRAFSRWSLAYYGDSSYVAELIAAVIEAPAFDATKQFDSIRALMLMLA